MKKLLIVLVALFAFVALGTTQAQDQCVANCAAQQMQPFPDVPAGHWAADAVDRITDLGIIIGFPDGNFNGNETLTRYQAALMFDRLINLLNANLASMQTIDDADIDALRRGIQSLSGEVASLAQSVYANEVAIDSISREYGAIQSNTARISSLELVVNELRNRPPQVVETRVETVSVPVDNSAPQTVFVDVPDELVQRINANTAAISRIDGLHGHIDGLHGRIDGLHGRIEDNSALIAELSALTGHVDVLHAKDAILADSIVELQQKVDAAQAQADAAMEKATRAIELLQALPSDGSSTPVHVPDNQITNRIAQMDYRVAENYRHVSALNALVGQFDRDLRTLRQQVDMLENRGGAEVAPDLSALEEGIASNRAQIQGIREFVILLRRNQVAFDSRLDALEDRIDGSVGDVASDLASLSERVQKVEDSLLTFSGSISSTFTVYRIHRAAFDIDRIFGAGDFRRKHPGAGESTFSTGHGNPQQDPWGYITDESDIWGNISRFQTNLNLNFGFSNAGSGAGAPNALNQFSGVVNLKLTRLANLVSAAKSYAYEQDNANNIIYHCSDGTTTTNSDKQDCKPKIIATGPSINVDNNAYAFAFDDALFYYEPIGADVLTFGFGRNVDVSFSSYVLNTKISTTNLSSGGTDGNRNTGGVGVDTSGFVAHLGSPDFLDFLAPELTVVYTSPDFVPGSSRPARNLGSDIYVLGIRGEMTPKIIDAIEATGGISYVNQTRNAAEYGNKNDDDIIINVFGADGTIGFSILDLEFEYAQASSLNTATNQPLNSTNDPRAIFYVKADVEPVDLGIIRFGKFDADGEVDTNALTVLYRDIAAGWNAFDAYVPNRSFDENYNGIADDDELVFHNGAWKTRKAAFGAFRLNGQATASGKYQENQAGIRVNTNFGLFIFDVDAYYDNYFVGRSGATAIETQAFGLDADIDILAGFAVTGFFHLANVEDSSGALQMIDRLTSARTKDNNNTRDTLTNTRRDGNNYDTGLGVGIKHDGDSAAAIIPNLDLSADFALINAGFDTQRIRASASYELDIAFLTLSPYASLSMITDPDIDRDNRVTIQAGLSLETDTLDVLFKPSLQGAFNYRTRDYRYKSNDPNGRKDYTASAMQFSVGLALNEFLLPHSVLTARYGQYQGTNQTANPGWVFGDSNRQGVGVLTSGYEITWDYYDLQFAYGVFTNDNDTTKADDTSTAQAFRIKYKVTF